MNSNTAGNIRYPCQLLAPHEPSSLFSSLHSNGAGKEQYADNAESEVDSPMDDSDEDEDYVSSSKSNGNFLLSLDRSFPSMKTLVPGDDEESSDSASSNDVHIRKRRETKIRREIHIEGDNLFIHSACFWLV